MFSTPETETLRHCPVMTMVLLTPLTFTTLSLHAMVLFSPTPGTLMLPPAGSSGTDAAVVVADGRFPLLPVGGTPNGPPPPPPDAVGLPLNVSMAEVTSEKALAKTTTMPPTMATSTAAITP